MNQKKKPGISFNFTFGVKSMISMESERGQTQIESVED